MRHALGQLSHRIELLGTLYALQVAEEGVGEKLYKGYREAQHGG